MWYKRWGRGHPKDMLDAAIGALTVREFEAGRGCEVGGGDGLGTIILPRPIPEPIEAVLTWPAYHGARNGRDWRKSERSPAVVCRVMAEV